MPKATHLTTEQELRASFVELLLNRPHPGSTVNAILQADAIVRFIMTREVVGLSPADVEQPPKQTTQRPARSASR